MARLTKLLLRRDTAANWSSTNPTLDSGEVGFDTSNNQFKIGDGTAAWNSLSLPNNQVPMILKPTTGQWFSMQQSVAVTGGTQPTRDVEICYGIILPFTATIDRMGVWVVTGGGVNSVCRFGFRDNNGSNRPGTLLSDAGTVATTANGAFANATTNQVLNAGKLYFLSVTPQGSNTSPIFGYPNTWLGPYFPDSTQNNNSLFGFSQTGVTGALPSTFTVTTRLGVGGTALPAIMLRVA